jgi:hypothetical protein
LSSAILFSINFDVRIRLAYPAVASIVAYYLYLALT